MNHSLPGSATPPTPQSNGDWSKFFELVLRAREGADFLRLGRERKRMLKEHKPQFQQTVRVAVLGGATTEMLLEPLLLNIEARGLGCELFEADYNVIAQEMLQPSEQLRQFSPDVTLALTTPYNISIWPEAYDSVEQAHAAAEEAGGLLAQVVRILPVAHRQRNHSEQLSSSTTHSIW